MSEHRLRIPDYLDHIIQAIGRIERYTSELSVSEFKRDEMVQDAVIRNIEIIGEAAGKILTADPRYTERHPLVPWKVMRAMRNRLTHGYFEVDLEIVWRTCREDLPKLGEQIRRLR